MPRQRRLHVPNALYHIIVYGKDRNAVFNDKSDREEFLRRLEKALIETELNCYAWALLADHFHILIRTGKKNITAFMRKLQPGYASYFNRRHGLSEGLFQSRYKAILCQDSYFLDLVRYIHLNPLRSKLVKSLKQLDSYPWAGHSAVIGKIPRPWVNSEEVLKAFAPKTSISIRKYSEYVADCAIKERREELVGGGLKRSLGWDEVKKIRSKKGKVFGDERVLGDSDFVQKMLQLFERSNSKMKDKIKKNGLTFPKIVKKVCDIFAISKKDLHKKGRANNLSEAKCMIAYWAHTELGMKQNAIADFFNISSPAISKSIQLGEKIAEEKRLKLI